MGGPTFIDLFSGAGGLSFGFRQAGWEPLLAVDNWPDAITTYQTNFPGSGVLCDDIGRVTESRLGELLVATPDWLVGGPPCQGFSTVGKRERDDPRNNLMRQFARLVELLQPRGLLIE